MNKKFESKCNKTSASANFCDKIKKLSKPTLNSVLRQEQQIKQLQKTKLPVNTCENEISQKVNFYLRANLLFIYKLIDLFNYIYLIPVYNEIKFWSQSKSIPKSYTYKCE